MKFVLGIVIGLVIGVLVIVFILQNIEIVQVTFLAWTISVNRALMVLVVFAVGVILGWLIGSIGRRRRAAKQE
jgi:putative membrane protein